MQCVFHHRSLLVFTRSHAVYGVGLVDLAGQAVIESVGRLMVGMQGEMGVSIDDGYSLIRFSYFLY